MAITLTKLATKAIEKVQQLMPPVDLQQSHQVMPLTTVGLDSSQQVRFRDVYMLFEKAGYHYVACISAGLPIL